MHQTSAAGNLQKAETPLTSQLKVTEKPGTVHRLTSRSLSKQTREISNPNVTWVKGWDITILSYQSKLYIYKNALNIQMCTPLKSFNHLVV